MNRTKLRFLILLILSSLVIAGCKVELYSDLNEKEANSMMAVLLKNGITCEKIPLKDKRYGLRIEQNQIAQAIDILNSHGYPKDQFVSVGEIFKKQGLVSSPLEERVRYIYALSQDLSETISKIDGVLSAKVHIVIPQNDPLSEKILPSSASVFIKHRMDVNIQTDVPKIKMLVVNSIEGLAYEKVTLFLFETASFINASKKDGFKEILGIHIRSDSITNFYIAAGIAVFLIVSFMTAAGIFFYNSRKKQSGSNE